MQHSRYATDMSLILASLQEPGNEGDETGQLPEEEEATLHSYPGTIGGIPVIITAKQELPPEYLDNTPNVSEIEPEQQPVIESEPPAQSTIKKEPPFFVVMLIIFCLFLFLDSADFMLTNLFLPTATITIIPQSHTVSANTSLALVDIEGRTLPALTLSQSQTNPATGKGHQDALSASGILTFYNAAFTPQTIDAGAVFTTGNGVQVVTDTTVTIPANNPPSDGEASTTAHAATPGTEGNIPAFSINGMISNTLVVKNLTDFSGGRNARDFTFVTHNDIQQAISALSPRLSQSVQAALTTQLKPAEQLLSPQCSKTVQSNHQASDEAASVTVTVSETCSASVYNQHALQSKATLLLTTQATRRLGRGFTLIGNVQVTIAHSTHTTLVLSLQGVWIYQVNEQKVKQQVYGKPRLSAIHLLTTMPGIARVSVSGIEDNQPLPTDPAHVRIVLIVMQP